MNEGLRTSSKNAVFAGILAGQLSYESQKRSADAAKQTLSLSASIQKDVARKTLAAKFETTDSSPVRAIDMQMLQVLTER